VVAPGDAAASTSSLPPEVPGNAAPPPQPFPPQQPYPQQQFPPPQPGWTQGGMAYPPPPAAIQWDLAWRGALLSGVGAGLLSSVPFISIGCCLWMLGAGAVCVSLYQKRVPGTLITPGMGMKLGAVAGLFGFAVNAVLSTASFVALRSGATFRQAMQDQMQKQMASNPDPKVQAMMERMLDWISSPQGAATMIVASLLMMGVVFVIFTAAGGALGASMSRGSRRELR